jgi:hypothetical protein
MREQQDTERHKASSTGTASKLKLNDVGMQNQDMSLTVRSPVSCSRASRGPPGSFEAPTTSSHRGDHWGSAGGYMYVMLII